MRVQFLGKGNRLLYCDDNVVRITQLKTLFKQEEMKEKKVYDFMKVVINAGPCIEFYNHYGELWDEVRFNKEYLKLAKKIANKIRIESNKYIESLKDDDFKNNEGLIPHINILINELVKKESEFINEIYTLPPKIFQPFQAVNIFFKNNTVENIEYIELIKIIEILYDILNEIFIEAGYIFKEYEEIGLQCYKANGEELLTFTSIDKKVICQMGKESKL